MVGLHAERMLEMQNCVLRLVQGQTGDTQVAQGIDVVWFRLENLLIEVHGSVEITSVVVLEGLFEGFLTRCHGWKTVRVCQRENTGAQREDQDFIGPGLSCLALPRFALCCA